MTEAARKHGNLETAWVEDNENDSADMNNNDDDNDADNNENMQHIKTKKLNNN